VTNSATLAVESDGLTSPASFANTDLITINDFSPATPYPSSIEVSCVPNPLTGLTVTITNLSHSYPSDIDMILVGPTGQAVMLMADAGDGNAINGATIVFSDAASSFLSQTGTILTGMYKPTDYGLTDNLPAPAPPRPYANALSSFIGTDPNGTWSLYVADDNYADTGLIAGGWSLTLTWGGNSSPALLSSVTQSSSGSYGSTLQGQAGTVYVIEASTDLINWTPILTNTLTSNLWNFVDVNSSNYSRRFYRAVSGPAVK
jgi:subtilisin-like proprotein convertase family protein